MARKVVQTELEDKEYRLLKEAVDKQGLSIKRGVREAVLQWVSTQIPVSEDPLFSVKPVRTGVETDSSKLDERLYREKRD
ncbi:hypothetical protein HQ586_10290 [Candidatus Bathyarchaeota archaeon]|nr:hypothetical protein [Candidatus Bathyarchaeota archaeon]